MRAVQIEEFGGPEVLHVADVPKPEPGDGEVLIEVSRAGMNFADTHQRENTYLSCYEVPLVLGGEVGHVRPQEGQARGLGLPPLLEQAIEVSALAQVVTWSAIILRPCWNSRCIIATGASAESLVSASGCAALCATWRVAEMPPCTITTGASATTIRGNPSGDSASGR